MRVFASRHSMLTHDSLPPARLEPATQFQVRPAEVHVIDRLHAIYRYRYIAAAMFVTVLSGSVLYAYWQTPLYRTSARLLIDLEDERSLAVEGMGPTRAVDYYQDPEPYFQTQYRILTGRELAARVTSKLNRADVTPDTVLSGVSIEPV